MSWINDEKQKELDNYNSEKFDWKLLIMDMLKKVTDPIVEASREKKERLIKQIVGYIIISIGSIFILTAIAILINQYFRLADWIGFIAIGIVTLVIGLIFKKT